MKKSCLILLVSVSFFLFGCGEDILNNTNTIGHTTVTLEFDLLEYLDPSQKIIQYGKENIIPGELGSYEVQSPTQSIDFRSEMGDVNSVESVEMTITINFHNDTGIVDLTYNAYLAAMNEDPLGTPPIISETVSLNGDDDVSSEIEVVSDERLLELFNEGVMQYLAQILFEISVGSDNISGEAEVVQFDITIVTTL
jgi:hypothetical protein